MTLCARTVHALTEAENAGNLRCATHGNAWSIYFDNPEGNLIEIYVHTPSYIPQPHLVPLDLTKTDAEITNETERHYQE